MAVTVKDTWNKYVSVQAEHESSTPRAELLSDYVQYLAHVVETIPSPLNPLPRPPLIHSPPCFTFPRPHTSCVLASQTVCTRGDLREDSKSSCPPMLLELCIWAVCPDRVGWQNISV